MSSRPYEDFDAVLVESFIDQALCESKGNDLVGRKSLDESKKHGTAVQMLVRAAVAELDEVATDVTIRDDVFVTAKDVLQDGGAALWGLSVALQIGPADLVSLIEGRGNGRS